MLITTPIETGDLKGAIYDFPEINDILINNKFYGIQTNLAVKVELNDLSLND